jgi:hypothetical protein
LLHKKGFPRKPGRKLCSKQKLDINMNILDKVIEQKHVEVAESKKKISLIEVKDSAFFHRNTFPSKKP